LLCFPFCARSATGQVLLRVEVKFVRDMLKGDNAFEMRMKLVEHMGEEYPYKDTD